MKTTRMSYPRSASTRAALIRLGHEAEASAFGALVGAIVGAGAGMPGVIAGTVFGAIVGALAGAVVDRDASRRAAHTRELDAEIGVTSGEIGAPNLAHPPSHR
jgi:uncharacterized protein YcfJ